MTIDIPLAISIDKADDTTGVTIAVNTARFTPCFDTAVSPIVTNRWQIIETSLTTPHDILPSLLSPLDTMATIYLSPQCQQLTQLIGMTALLLLFTLSACAPPPQPSAAGALNSKATVNPRLVATAQADQYFRDAQATLTTESVTLQAAYAHVAGTAQSATSTAVFLQSLATSTTQAQQTQSALTFALTADAATMQAQETAVAATSQANSTATAQKQQDDHATSTAVFQATTTAHEATRQAFELEQSHAKAQREQILSIATIIGVIIFTAVFLIITAIFLWKLIPTLLSRIGTVRYGQHGNPLFLSNKGGTTVITDPLKMVQPALIIDGQGEVNLPELTPNQLQLLMAGGVLQTLWEQIRHAPGHPPQLPTETHNQWQLGNMSKSSSTAYHTPRRTSQNGRSLPTSATQQPILENGRLATADHPLASIASPLPSAIDWVHLVNQAHPDAGVALGMGQQDVLHLNFARTPHVLLCGSSGSGKTRRTLRPLIAQALVQDTLVVIMNESGADFSPFYDHPNAAFIRGDAQTYTAVLEMAITEMNRREAMLRQARVSEWRRLPDHLRDAPPVLLVIDEVLALAMLMSSKAQKNFWGLFAAYASRARKLAMGSIGALTDPTYRILGDGLNWREQCNARITFRVAKVNISRAVLDSEGAEALNEGQFLAMLGSPDLVQGVAAHPNDEDLIQFISQQMTPPLQQPEWLRPFIDPSQQLSGGQAAPPIISAQPSANIAQPRTHLPIQHGNNPINSPQPAYNRLQPLHNQLQPRQSATQTTPQPHYNHDTTSYNHTNQSQPVVQPVVENSLQPHFFPAQPVEVGQQPVEAEQQPVAHVANQPEADPANRQAPPQSDVPQRPFDATQPPTPQQQAYIQELYSDGMSKNGICRYLYGYKDGRVLRYVNDALTATKKETTSRSFREQHE